MGTPIPGGREGNLSAGHQLATVLNLPSQPEHRQTTLERAKKRQKMAIPKRQTGPNNDNWP